MSLKNVLDNVVFDPKYTADDIKEFNQILADIYNTPTGKKMLEDGIAGPGITINHIDQVDNAFAQPNTGNIFINLAVEDNIVGIDETGNSFAMNNRYVVTHELVHAIEGHLDLDPGSLTAGANDYEGPTERFTKKIMDEMENGQYRASYTSATTIDNIKPGESFTNGAEIDNAVVNHSGNVKMVEGLAGNRDLIIDLSRGDAVLSTGRGNDFIHARAGNDTINPGIGNDWVDAGIGNDKIIAGEGMDFINGGDGLDHIDYSKIYGPIRLPFTTNEGLEIKIDGSDTQVVKVTPGFFLESDPKIYQLDTLKDIEHITGSSRDDVFTVENLSGNMYISGGRGNDTLIINDPEGAFNLDMTGGTYPPEHPRAGESYTGTVSDGTNTIYLEDKDLNVSIEKPSASMSEAESDAGLELEEAIEILSQDQKTLNQRAEDTGVSTPANEAINHPDALQMFQNLQAAGVSTLKTDVTPEMGVDERVGNILNAGQDATQEAGLPMPHEQREQESTVEQSQRMPESSYEDDHSFGL